MPLIPLTIPAMLALCLSIIWLLTHPGKHKEINHLLSFLLFILAYNLMVINGHLSHSLFYHKLTTHLTYSDAFLFFLTMPLFYILFVYIIKNRPFLSYKNAKHIWPALPGLLYCINFSIRTDAEQEQILNGSHCGIFPDNLLYILGLGSTLFYICLSINFLRKNFKENQERLSSQSSRQIQFYAWILYFFLFLIICYGILTLIAPSSFEIHDTLLALLVCLSFIYVFIVFYIKPGHLHLKKENSANNSTISEEEKREQLNIIISKLDRVINKNKIFLKTDFDINTLIEAAQIPGYKISTCIHEQFNISVPEYINQFRISYAKKCLTEESMSSVKIDFLAQECGFSSRSNFYSTFKRHTGLTPLEYKKQFTNHSGSDN